MSITSLRQPMRRRPRPGTRVHVFFGDGSRKLCSATLVRDGAGSRVVLYHRRRAIDESGATGWSPVALSEPSA